MPRLYLNSTAVTSVSVVSQVLLGSMAGYAFARLQFRGKTLIFFALLTTMMVPFEVLIIPVFLLIKFFPLAGGNDILGQGGTGLINTLGGVMFPGFVSVFGVFLFRQFYLGFPKEIEEAAIVDGCSRIGRILAHPRAPTPSRSWARWRSSLSCGPGTTSSGPWSWSRKDSLKTVQLGLSVFDQEQGTAWAELMAASVMAVVPVIMLYIFLQRFLVSGGLTTGLKG